MFLTIRRVFLVLCLILLIRKAEFALTITSAPENPFLVLEGSNITLVWQYNLGGTFSNLSFRLLGSPVVNVVDKFDINADALISVAYEGRIQENVTTSHTAITILDVKRSDSGKYEFEIFTKPPPIRDRAINETVITVQFKPEIVKPLVNDSTVCEGDVISITCLADSRPAVHTYQLFENGIPVADGNSSAGVWTVRRDLIEGNFSYRCVASNTMSTSEETVNITVKVPSKVYPLENITVVEGENRTLTCNASGSMLTVTWTEVSTGNQSNGIMRYLANISRNDAGEYKCEAINDCGNSSASTFLTVLYKPENFKFTVSKSTVCRGTVVTFNCSAEGIPAVDKYQLLENDSPVSDGSNSLGMWSRNMSSGGVSIYKCMANNSAGTAYSMSLNVTVNVPSSIQVVQDQNVTEGNNLTLTCIVSGIPSPMVFWIKPDGQSENGSVLKLVNIRRNQTGAYRCEASNVCGNATEMASIDVQFKPEKVLLTTSAMNKTACLGDVINFTCSADANPTVTSYQLFRNDSSILDTSMSGMWNETLEIAGVFFYRCVAKNTLGSTHSTDVMLTVNVRSSIEEIVDQNVTEGKNLTLTCNVSGIPLPMVTWTTPHGHSTVEKVLVVTNISRNQAGEYKCEASNDCGNAIETAIINVQYEPDNVQLTSSARNNTACKGEAISFNCSADANPAVTYQLFENETAILQTNSAGIWSKTLEKEGVFVYKCVANNSLGSAYSMNVTVTVDVPSSIIQITQHQSVTEGDNVTLICNVSGVPPPMVSWLTPNGERVSNYKLEVKNVSRGQAGEYKCEASNECGNAADVTRIDVRFKPENVLLMSSAMNNTACKGKVISFNCSADAHPAVTSYQLFENEIAIFNRSATGMWSKSLEKEGEFVYKCVANNSLGSEYSMSVTVTVNVPSTIETIQDQNVTEGETINLICAASGMPQPNVFWIKPNNQSVPGNVLKLVNISRNEAGQYKCEASNECGNATAMASIDVHYPPENVQFTTSAMDNKACTGDMISFNCSADANPAVTSYQLFENDTAILDVTRLGVWKRHVSTGEVFTYKCVANNSLGSGVSSYVMVTVNVPSTIETIQDQNVTEGETINLTCAAAGMPHPNVFWIKPNNQSVAGNVLKLVNISRNEAGQYKCEASNECGNATAMASIDVHYTPENLQFTTSAMDNKACTGDMISFNCSADANPAVTSYQLFENDTAILDVTRLGVWKRHVSTGGVFMYKCVANNSLGSGVSSYVMVTVNVPSTIETIQDQNVTEGETINLTCAASGMPQPNVSWIKPNNQRVPENVLKLVNISRNEAGQYKCEASNECGNATAMASIDVHYKPENVQLTTSVVDSKASQGDTIAFNCSADAKPAVTSYKLFKNGTDMKVNLLGMWKETLENRGVFVYKCMATNTLGSTYSADVTFTVNGGLCEQPCTGQRSCSKFGEKNVCSCPTGKTGTNCEVPVEPKKNFVVGLKIKREFKQVYEDLENPETKTLVEEIKTNTIAEFQGTGLASVKVLKLRPGSIIADLELTFNKSVGQSSVDALLTQAVNKGKLGSMEVEDAVVGETFPDTSEKDCGTFFEGEDCKKAKPGLIVLCVVGGVAVLAIIVAIIAYGLHRKKSDVGSFSNGNYERADPNGTAGSAERTSPGNVYGSVNQGYHYDGTNGQSQEMVTFKGITPNPAQTPGITINDSSMTKKAQPGEGMYADLGEFHQKAPAPPTTPVKMPPEYERTEYAEITQFLRVPVKTDDEKENDEKENDEKENDEKENGEKEDESNVEKNSSPDKGEDPSPDMGDDPSPDMGDAGDRNSSGPVGFVVSI